MEIIPFDSGCLRVIKVEDEFFLLLSKEPINAFQEEATTAILSVVKENKLGTCFADGILCVEDPEAAKEIWLDFEEDNIVGANFIEKEDMLKIEQYNGIQPLVDDITEFFKN